jgi:hypothetical protein
MRILCKLGFHKWRNYKQDVTYGSSRGHKPLPYYTSKRDVRICDECMKKQIKSLQDFRPRWSDFNHYTRDEKRKMALHKIEI